MTHRFWTPALILVLLAVSAHSQTLQVIPVPFKAQDPSVPHPAYNGHPTTLKAIARGAGGMSQPYYYRWDLDGDGQWDQSMTKSRAIIPGNWYQDIGSCLDFCGILPTVNPNQAPRKLYLATIEVSLQVGSNGIPINSTYATYPILVYADVPSETVSTMSATNAQLAIMRDVAIDDALWWMHKQMYRPNEPSSTMTGYLSGTSGVQGTIAATALFLQAMTRNGHLSAYPPSTYNSHGTTVSPTFHLENDSRYSTDPYAEDVARALNYLLTQIVAVPGGIPSEDEADDGRQPITGTNDNAGCALASAACDDLNHNALALGALVLSEMGSTVAQTGGNGVLGKTYNFIIQQLIDFAVYAQIDNGDDAGGWTYYPNQTGPASSYISGMWYHALVLADQSSMPWTVNLRCKYRIPNMLVRNQLPNGGPCAFNVGTSGTPSPVFEPVGLSIMACQWLGWESWLVSDGSSTPYGPQYTKGYYRGIYDKYLSYAAQNSSFATIDPSTLFSATRSFWIDGSYGTYSLKISSNSGLPRAHVWTYSLFAAREATRNTTNPSLFGLNVMDRHVPISLINAQSKGAGLPYDYFKEAGFSLAAYLLGNIGSTSLAVLAMTPPLSDADPVAIGSATPATVMEGCVGPPAGQVTFSHQNSFHPSPSRQISEYQWLFADPSPSMASFESISWSTIPMNSYSQDGKAWRGNVRSALPTHTYLSRGTHYAALRVVDNSVPQRYDHTIITVTVEPQPQYPPVSSAGGPYLISTGQDLVLNGSMSDPNQLCYPSETLIGTWYFASPTPLATGPATTVTWSQLCSVLGWIPGPGVEISLRFVVTDATSQSAESTTTLRINQRPVAKCRDVVVFALPNGCTGFADVDDGSYDPENDPITITQSPPGPYNLGTTLVTLTVSDVYQNTSSCTASVTVVDNIPPAVPTLVTVSGECSASVTTPTTTDNCAGTVFGATNDPLVYTTQGTHTLTWTFDDGNGNTATQTQTVVIDDATVPVPTLTSLPDIIGECNAMITTTPIATDNCAGTVLGTTSDPLTYSTQGTHMVTWTYNDGNGNSTQQTQRVIVQDVSGPLVGLNQIIFYLWSPNHKYETITMSQIVSSLTDNCGSATIKITHATSDEPEDDPGTGDGATLDDLVIASNCQSIDVRSERDGTRNGRVYRIYLEAEDENGNKTYTSFRIDVQHSANTPAIEDAAVYTEYSTCYTPKQAVVHAASPDGYMLEQNYPNPFNPVTSILYTVPEEQHVRILVHDLHGRQVRCLVDKVMRAGRHAVEFDGSDVPSGTYIYRLQVRDRQLTKIMTLQK